MSARRGWGVRGAWKLKVGAKDVGDYEISVTCNLA